MSVPDQETWKGLPAMVMMFASHDAFRRDLRDFGLLAAQPGTIPADADTAWHDFHTLLDQHHRSEDLYLWPLARARLSGSPERAAELDLMQDEHARLDPLLDQADDAFAQRDRGQLALVIGSLRESLDQHLSDEETMVLPWLARLLTAADWASYQKQSRKAPPGPKSAPIFLPWITYRRTDPPGTGPNTVFPAPLRLIIRAIMLPRYIRRQGWRTDAARPPEA
jgi:hypothetical protein